MAICYNDIGDLYYHQKNYGKALFYFKKALHLTIAAGDLIYVSSSYINLGKAYRQMDSTKKAIANLMLGLSMAKSIKAGSYLTSASLELSETYESMGNMFMALNFYKNYVHYKDSISTIESQKYLNRMQVLYESGKKDKEIEFLKFEEIVTLKKHRIVVVSLVVGCIFLFVLLSMYFYNNRLKKKVNRNLISHNQEIEEKNRLLMLQKEEIIQQKNEIELKSQQINQAYELVSLKNNSTLENIRYALQIQTSLFPEKDYIDRLLPENFLFYKPKDIVSGDFYWLSESNNKIIIVVGDCTGHGVTGAFMSILGITVLNEIVIENKIITAHEILNQLRKKIIWTLQQGGEFIEMRDGIQMVVCVLDKENFKLQFSGAMNSIILVRNGELFVYKGEMMPISIYPNMVDFTSTEITLASDDMIYLYTDGYYGQFGGMFNRKFNLEQFKYLLKGISSLPLNSQLNHLEDTFQSWIGNGEQVDDILVMGIKIG